MAGRCRELQLICSIGQTQKNTTRRTKQGARIEIASFKNGSRIRKRCAQRKSARVEIASFSEWLAIRKRCAQRTGARIEDAAHKEWRTNKNRMLLFFVLPFPSFPLSSFFLFFSPSAPTPFGLVLVFSSTFFSFVFVLYECFFVCKCVRIWPLFPRMATTIRSCRQMITSIT